MKALLNKFIVFNFSLFILLSCSSVPKEYLKNDNSHCYNDPIFKITKDEMTFDVEKYRDTSIAYYKGKYKKEYTNIMSINMLITTDSIKRIQKFIDYDAQGKITQSSFSYIDGDSPIGKETYYNKQGKVTKIRNPEKNYNICWSEVLDIVKNKAKNEIKKYEIKTFRLTHFIEEKTKEPIWVVALMDGNKKYKEFRFKKNRQLRYYINGETGKNITRYRNKERIRNLKYSLINILNPVPKEFLENNDICHYNYPIFKITKDEMSFDVEKYAKELEKGNFILVDNEIIEDKYNTLSNKDIINYKTYKKLNIGKWIRYNKNGKIKSSTFMYLNGSSEIGKETEYDQQGNITKVIDYEKGYKICWAEAIAIVKQIAKKDIERYEVTGFNLSHTNLNEYPNKNPVWAISLDGNEEYELKDTKVYWIDGITGKFIKTTKIITEHGI